MKRFFNWQVMLAIILIALSVIFYCIHYFIFRDLHHIVLYLIGDIAFLFIDVLLVMLVLQRLLMYREKQLILKKLNMVVGTFFSEVGTDLLKKCAQFDPQVSDLAQGLLIKNDWSDRNFLNACKRIRADEHTIHCAQGNIEEVKHFLVGKRQFLLSLLENPYLLEHETFTNLLWAVFHLTDELSHRRDFLGLPESDLTHLSGDIKRVYNQLILQWLDYMKHLKRDYPYLFSLALRTNPFDEQASVVVK